MQTTEQGVDVFTDVEVDTIKPELHGHFVEHPGSCIYDGLRVGPVRPRAR